MTATNDVLLDERIARRWLNEYATTSASASSTSESMVDGVLLRLADEAWIPGYELRPALEVAASISASSDFSPRQLAFCLVDLERRRRTEIDAFAKEFFTLPVEARDERWRELWNRCEGAAAARRRLTRLRPGLTVSLPETDDAPLRQLMADAGEWFTARPTERAAIYQRIQNRLPTEAAERRRLVDAFHRTSPEWAKLAPLRFEHAEAVDEDAPRLDPEWYHPEFRVTTTEQVKSREQIPRWFLWLVGGLLLRFLGTAFNHSHETRSSPGNSITPRSDLRRLDELIHQSFPLVTQSGTRPTPSPSAALNDSEPYVGPLVKRLYEGENADTKPTQTRIQLPPPEPRYVIPNDGMPKVVSPSIELPP